MFFYPLFPQGTNLKHFLDVHPKPLVLPSNLIDMYFSENDDPHSRIHNALERFNVAWALYQKVITHRPQQAICYRLEDRQAVQISYEQINHWIRTLFIQSINQQPGQTPQNILTQLIQQLHVLQQAGNMLNIPIIGGTQTVQISFAIAVSVANHLLNHQDIGALQIAMNQNDFSGINAWFEARRDNDIPVCASQDFFQMQNLAQAYDTGKIYCPDVGFHNWGVNAAWAYGIGCIQSEVLVLSALNIGNETRTHPRPNRLNPSAFSLEIAIFVKMGYGLRIDNNVVTLIPSTEMIHNPKTDGTPGNGMLPTKQEQMDIFSQCVIAREMHDMIHSPNLGDYVRRLLPQQANHLIQALDLLRKGNSLTPILAALASDQPLLTELALAVIQYPPLNQTTLRDAINAYQVNPNTTPLPPLFSSPP